MSTLPDPASAPLGARAQEDGPAPAASSLQDPHPARTLEDDPAGLLAAGALRPVSTALIPARYVAGIVGYVLWVLMIAGAIVGAVLTSWWWLALLGLLPLALLVQSLLLTPRRVRAIGYLDAQDDLTIARGIMFRTVHTIPYGRVQSVKIDEGPVDRRYGLAKLTVSTASDGTTVVLPGLPKEEAERLRALLTARGIENMAAL
ncbi:PH domain-containing protein [Brachybacterium saurashtrense]|uniref:PH domain-containing protein n=1 Tax=Brachybacterium saurashtrense TaxID=556288 RepID=A0A345YLL7_9MICO|nr:PH domain-containing protein [Brachybacterium saurashtrense]AXK44819.1 PH domain-containing protein [Brachybacterium saurashtrense]RRR20795.1 PH domain-containing protein [Brachybacterium saurashtrense]